MTFQTYGELYSYLDYRRLKCNMCGAELSEKDVLIEDETGKEYCPECHATGYLMDIGGGDE